MFKIEGKYTTATIYADTVEPSCMAQITSMVNHPAFTNQMALMPDLHAGKGSVIGFTMPMSDKVIPNIVGVDIGCSVLATRAASLNGLSMQKIDDTIQDLIPMGQSVYSSPACDFYDDFPWETATRYLKILAGNLTNLKIENLEPYSTGWFLKKCRDIGYSAERAERSIGTLGGGNHFIELGLAESDDSPWLTIHTGSRGFGKAICEYHQKIAVAAVDMERKRRDKEVFSGPTEGIQSGLRTVKQSFTWKQVPGGNALCYLTGAAAGEYLRDLIFAQAYAMFNITTIRNRIFKALRLEETASIRTVHNYIDPWKAIIRKGAVRSEEYLNFLLPFNMADGILICEGKSNPDWNYSAPHGAGRVLSRSAAKASLDLEEFHKDMKTVYSTSVGPETLDEAPRAYKPMQMITSVIGPTAKIIDQIFPILNIKSHSKRRSEDERIAVRTYSEHFGDENG